MPIEVPLSLFGSSGFQSGSLVNLPANHGYCSTDLKSGFWFSFVPQTSNDILEAMASNNSIDVELVFFNSCNSEETGLCYNNYPAGQRERVRNIAMVPGQTYYVLLGTSQELMDGEEVRLQINSFVDGRLAENYCDVHHYRLNQSIYAERDDLGQLYPGAVTVDRYEFRFEDLNTGQIVYDHHMNWEPYMQWVNVTGAEYGDQFNVSVRHSVVSHANGNSQSLWSPFGSSCPVSLDSILPTTRLVNMQCPCLHDQDYQSLISAQALLGADEYRFHVEGQELDYSFEKPIAGFTVQELGLYPHGAAYASEVYQVSVQTRFGNQWSEPGDTCLITMLSSAPDTRLKPTFCGGSFSLDAQSEIEAVPVFDAERYEFEFYSQLFGRSAYRSLEPRLILDPAELVLSSSGDYSIRVRAFAGGTWGDFNEACTLSIDIGP